jgi:hypothetical protein
MNLMLKGIDAMKGTTARGELTIKSEAGDGQLLISVSDAGVGLPLEQAEQIFQAFFTTKTAGLVWGCPSVGQLLSRMEGAGGPVALPGKVQLFSSPCPPRSRRTHNVLSCSSLIGKVRCKDQGHETVYKTCFDEHRACVNASRGSFPPNCGGGIIPFLDASRKRNRKLEAD